MSGGFEELPGITADAGISAWGDTPEEAFAQAAEGLASLLSDRSRLRPAGSRSLSVAAPTREGALVAFLNEIVFAAENGGFLPLRVESLVLDREKDGWSVRAVLAGEPFDPSRHRLLSEVKAATWHGLEVRSRGPGTGGKTTLRVIFDV